MTSACRIVSRAREDQSSHHKKRMLVRFQYMPTVTTKCTRNLPACRLCYVHVETNARRAGVDQGYSRQCRCHCLVVVVQNQVTNYLIVLTLVKSEDSSCYKLLLLPTPNYFRTLQEMVSCMCLSHFQTSKPNTVTMACPGIRHQGMVHDIY